MGKKRMDKECPICLETTSKMVTLLVCKHTFCGSCLLRWESESPTCPLCRTHIRPTATVCKKRSTILLRYPPPQLPHSLYSKEEDVDSRSSDDVDYSDDSETDDIDYSNAHRYIRPRIHCD